MARKAKPAHKVTKEEVEATLKAFKESSPFSWKQPSKFHSQLQVRGVAINLYSTGRAHINGQKNANNQNLFDALERLINPTIPSEPAKSENPKVEKEENRKTDPPTFGKRNYSTALQEKQSETLDSLFEVFDLEDKEKKKLKKSNLTNEPPTLPLRLSEKEEEVVSFRVYFDGSSLGNPGLGGAGSSVEMSVKRKGGEGEQRTRRGFAKFLGGAVGNNQAEYEGMILGLKKVEEWIRETEVKRGIVRVQGDSDVVIKQMKNIYKARELEAFHRRGQEVVEKLAALGFSVEFKHIRRHFNALADGLARYGGQIRGRVGKERELGEEECSSIL